MLRYTEFEKFFNDYSFLNDEETTCSVVRTLDLSFFTGQG